MRIKRRSDAELQEQIDCHTRSYESAVTQMSKEHYKTTADLLLELQARRRADDGQQSLPGVR